MVTIPLHDYEGNLDKTYGQISIKNCYWTGKTFRFTCVDSDKSFFCYAVHPELPKVKPEEWLYSIRGDYLWGSEIDGSALQKRISNDQYYFYRKDNRWYLDICGTAKELKKKEELVINGNESDKALVFYGAVNQPTMDNYLVNKYATIGQTK